VEEIQMNKNRGFTLVEIMTVVVIIGILVAIAWPSYQSQLRKGRRAAAQTYMSDIANLQQQYLLDARAYAPDFATLNKPAPTDLANFYTFTMNVPGGAPPTFTITATAIGQQVATGGAQGEDLTLDNNGTKTRGGLPGW
jgi:type IV pilus assembly protein PilE